MTNKEAIEFAECLKNNWTINFDDLELFCDMAIEALKSISETPSAQEDVSDINVGDTVSRRAAIDILTRLEPSFRGSVLEQALKNMPPAQRGRDIPVKPIETTDRAWGIPNRQAVCPKCDYYLGHVAFLGDYKGKRITYCETCGQAIDWEGWDFDE